MIQLNLFLVDSRREYAPEEFFSRCKHIALYVHNNVHNGGTFTPEKRHDIRRVQPDYETIFLGEILDTEVVSTQP